MIKRLKTIWIRVGDWYRQLPMMKKTTYTYIVPLVLISITVNLIAYPVLSESYESQLQQTVNQGWVQAQNFISNYLSNMNYISELIVNNNDIKKILSSTEFAHLEQIDDQYRQYLELNKAFQAITLANSTYRIGLYIPDRLFYSSNEYYFFPQSNLETRVDYEELIGNISIYKHSYALQNEIITYSPLIYDQFLSLFRGFDIVDDEGNTSTYICKVELSINVLATVLSNANNISDSVAMLMNDNGEVIASTSNEITSSVDGHLLKATNTHFLQFDSWTKHSIKGSDYFLVKSRVPETGWHLVNFISVKQFKQQMVFITLLLILTLVVMTVAVIVVSYLLSRYYVSRFKRLQGKIKAVEEGSLFEGVVTKTDSSADEFDQIFIDFSYMSEQLIRLLREHYALGKNVMSAELRALQAQINPHFLYNTLDIINWSAMDYGANEIADIAQNLGRFYRLSLNKGKSVVRIADELELVQSFVKIENVHFNNRIKLSIDVDQDILNYGCLSIILQPFIENAIVHGIAKNPEMDRCHIQIKAVREEDEVEFFITDNGKGIPAHELTHLLPESKVISNNGFGIQNTNFRIKLCYGDEYGISYESTEDIGTTVRIHIPLLTVEAVEAIIDR